MKKVNFKNVMTMLAVTLAFLFVSVDGAKAQAITDAELAAVYQGNYVTVVEAQDLLSEQLGILKDMLETLIAGIPFDVTLRKYIYFDGVNNELLTGKSIPQSIIDGLSYLNDSNGNGNLSKSQQSQLMQEAITVLTN